MGSCWIIVLSVAVLVCNYNAVPTWAQFGKECSEVRSCMPDQTCYVGYCKCNRGYVKNIQHCFPVRNHGQMCFVETQCVDYRMTCAKEHLNAVFKSCICDEYHTWDDSLKECMQTMNITSMLASQQEKYDNLGKIQKEADEIFAGAIAAGLLVIVLGALFAVACAVYGCCECECLFGNGSESIKSEKLDRERFRPKQKDPENPSARSEPVPAPGRSPGWQEVVSTVPVQAVVLTS